MKKIDHYPIVSINHRHLQIQKPKEKKKTIKFIERGEIEYSSKKKTKQYRQTIKKK